MYDVKFKVFRNRRIDFTFEVSIKNAPILRPANQIIVIFKDKHHSNQSVSAIKRGYGSGLMTYNDTLTNTSTITLRSKKDIREKIINNYHLKVDKEYPGTLEVLNDGTHLYYVSLDIEI